ncbi:MAG: Ig-like domain-containing protein, partial [Limnohabitans sp.]|nr:Ig-like domain-containing protein [Limnohabitans sp.]
YNYTVTQGDAAVEALLPSSTPLTDTFTYTVKDAAGATSQQTITVSITGANDAPVVQVALADQNATPDSLLTYQFAGDTGTATDTFQDVDTGHQTGLTYSATLANGSSLPSWLSFDAVTRTFSGTPPASAASTNVTVKVTATDALGAITSDDFIITIGAVPAASVLTALTIDPITGDNVILNAENTGNIAVTGTVTGTFATGDIVTLSINGNTYSGTAAANGTYSINVPAADLAADTDTQIEGSVTGGNGGTLATAAQNYVLEPGSTNTQTTLAIDPVTADNLLAATEADGSGNVAITGTVTGTFAQGDVVTLSVHGTAYSGTVAADGSYSIDVQASDLVADADTTIDGTVTGTGGTLATALQNYGLDTRDTTAPTIAISSNQASLGVGQTATITFAVSEATSDFAWDGSTGDLTVTGGRLSALTHVGLNSSGQDIYTATFTPTANSSTNGVIRVAAGQFQDAAGNQNLDTWNSADTVTDKVVETDNTVTLTVNTIVNQSST